ncbi:MAG: transcriptional regulator [Actinobacteria bacterium]|nr:transcriptional regulator [Actinomycetota bacterium]
MTPQRRCHVIDRPSLLTTFRERLEAVVQRSGLSRGEFAEQNQLDRSTLSQLLSSANRRLPRAETLAEIASTQQVSIDWLLGLAHAGPMQAEMLQEQTSFAENALSYNDERLIGWFEEARGYKIRYVPSTIPDLLKTEDVIRYELAHYVASRPEQKIETAAARLAWTRGPESDLETCNSLQAIESLARGEGIWRGLPHAQRVAQMEHMIGLTDELYPTLRWFLFDGLQRYAAPVTIFGPQRAALYLGQMYLVLTSTEHVRTLTRHFDDLIRGAVVQPNEISDYLAELLRTSRRVRTR